MGSGLDQIKGLGFRIVIQSHLEDVFKKSRYSRSQEETQAFDYDELEDVECCVTYKRFIAMGKEQKIDKINHEIYGDMESEIFMAPFVYKRTLVLWFVETVDFVQRQECQMAKTMEIIHCFKTEALADKEKVIRLQGQLLVQKNEQLQLRPTKMYGYVQIDPAKNKQRGSIWSLT